tara:strand:- start:541 stop:822 length:282 start_codon:yes stop_codon:yes gene_type:complete
MPSVVIKPSTNPKKKLMAQFSDPKKTIHFGAAGASDYTINKDDDRKKRYLDRHRKNEDWSNPRTAGALSRWILWNLPTRRASISDFKRRFSLS